MKLFLTALFFSLISTSAFADGSQGQYYIVGTAYGADSVSLKNVSLVVKFGKETKTIKTNEQGWFEIEVKWATPCRTGRRDAGHVDTPPSPALEEGLTCDLRHNSCHSSPVRYTERWERFRRSHGENPPNGPMVRLRYMTQWW